MSSYLFIAIRIDYWGNAAAVYLYFLSDLTVGSVATLLAWRQWAWSSVALARTAGFL